LLTDVLVGRTTIGIKCADGIIMAVEKTLLSKMLVPGTHRRIYAIDRHVGLVRSLSAICRAIGETNPRV
jgi:20S proteasome alpha/beta subunit